MNRENFANKGSFTSLEKLQSLTIILEHIANLEYKKLGLVSCYYNSIPTRISCPKCNQRKNRVRPHVFRHTRGVAHHLVGSGHYHDASNYPTIDQSLKIVEAPFYSTSNEDSGNLKEIFFCADNNPKEFEIIFDSGCVPNDLWRICRICYSKIEFRYYRISEKRIDKEKKS